MIIFELFRAVARRFDRRPLGVKSGNVSTSAHKLSQVSPVSCPKVTIVIPTRDKKELLQNCIESIISLTTYQNYEIVIVNNDSREARTLEYLSELLLNGISVLQFPHKFNYSAICNYAVANTSSDYICLLNNDTEVLSPRWLNDLVEHALSPEVAVVGALLLYPDLSVQHIGVALGFTGVAGHAFRGESLDSPQVKDLASQCFEVSAVTFACALVPRKIFIALGGLDEKFAVGLNDVDFCLRTANLGMKTVLCSKAKLVHHESMSRRPMRHPLGLLRATIEVSSFLSLHSSRVSKDAFFSS